MAPSKAKKPAKASPKWVIDLHGMKEALTTKKNSVRSAIVDAIECGDMHILRHVSPELKELYPGVYADFQQIKNKKYVTVSVAAGAAAAIMMESSGANPLGGMPLVDRFEALAAARTTGCCLVSAGKAHSDCVTIARQNSLPSSCVADAATFS